MTDCLDKKQRHRCMSRIKSKNSKPELLLRKALWKQGLRYRLHDKNLPGKPDVVFKKAKVAVFMDGCFWHGCPQHGHLPQNNRDFWKKKIYGNIARDRRTAYALQEHGWKVLRFWQHEIERNLEEVVAKIQSFVYPAATEEQSRCDSYRYQPGLTIADEAPIYKEKKKQSGGD